MVVSWVIVIASSLGFIVLAMRLVGRSQSPPRFRNQHDRSHSPLPAECANEQALVSERSSAPAPRQRWWLGLLWVVCFGVLVTLILSHVGQHLGSDLIAVIAVLVLVVFILRYRQIARRRKPVAVIIENETVFFEEPVLVGMGSGGSTHRHLVVREHSFELTGSPRGAWLEPWFARADAASMRVTTGFLPLVSLHRQPCIAVTFPDGTRPTTLWLYPRHRTLSSVWKALAQAGVRSEGPPP